MSSNTVIRMQNLSKVFGSDYALSGINLEVQSGRIIGLLGANGSGKSTLLRHIIGLYLPTEGECWTYDVMAENLASAELSRIGYVHQEGELLDYLTVNQHIRYIATHYTNWNQELEKQFIARFELNLEKKVGSLSPGQRQRLAILLAVCFEPELLILDEPAAALDPLARRDFLNVLLEMIQDPQRTIIISSHILSDVEKIIDQVLVLNKGQICCNQNLDDLRESYCRVKLTSLNGSLPEQFELPNLLEFEHNEGQAILTFKNQTTAQIESMANELNCQASTMPVSFDEIFRLIVQEQSGREVAQ